MSAHALPYGTHFDDVMVIIGFGKGHLRLLCTCGLLLMFTITETMGMAIIAPKSACEFASSEQAKAAIQAAAYIGMILSSYMWGYFCDKIGRRTVLLRSTAMAIVCSFSSMLITNFWIFLTLRFMTGICVAGPGFAALTYLGEFCTPKNRASIINYMCMFNGIAMVYCPGLSQLMVNWKLYIPIIGNLIIRPWRILGLLFSVPGWISFLLLLRLPESPKFLLLVNKNEECSEVLNWLCLLNNGKTLEDFGITNMRALLNSGVTPAPNVFRAMAQEVVPLFRHPYIKRFLISCVVMFGLLLVANGVAIWFTDIRNHTLTLEQENKNKSHEMEFSICEAIRHNKKLAKETMVVSRKPIFCISLTISGICGICLPFVTSSPLIPLTFILYLSIPAVMTNLMNSAVLEFIPTYVRGKAVCICLIFGRFGAVFGTTIMAQLIESFCFEAFMLFSCFPFVCAICGYFLPLDEHFF
nr:synaptic vesicle glycoprotein 2A isoform X2 [Bactrocera oleae]